MEHEDYQAPPPSERHLACLDIAAAVREMGLAKGYGGECKRHFQGKYRYVEFTIRGAVQGQVSCYGTDYLQVHYRGTVPGMPPQDRRTFTTAEEVIAFLRLAFVEGKPEDALSIPLRQSRRRAPVSAKEQPADPPHGHTAEGVPPSFDADFLSADRAPPPVPDDLTGLLAPAEEDDNAQA